MLEKVTEFDKVGVTKHEIDKALSVLKELKQNFPFTENLRAIEWLDPDKLYKLNPDAVGEFFQLLEDTLKPIIHSNINSSNVYRNARLQIVEFKNLLRITVDDRKSLAQKIDSPWERIGGIGQDKFVAKKIIYCFNTEKGTVLPIFNDQHLRYFVNHIANSPRGQTKYLSPGQEYQLYTEELIKAKNSSPITQNWDSMYFTAFLFAFYPPPDTEVHVNSSGGGKNVNIVTDEQLELRGFVKLLGELQTMGKITGEEFREKRELWMRQQPNDRDVLVWQLKQLLNAETKNPNSFRDQTAQPKKPSRQKL